MQTVRSYFTLDVCINILGFASKYAEGHMNIFRKRKQFSSLIQYNYVSSFGTLLLKLVPDLILT